MKLYLKILFDITTAVETLTRNEIQHHDFPQQLSVQFEEGV